MQQFIQFPLQNQKNTTMFIQKLEVQVSKLAKQLADQKMKSISSSTQVKDLLCECKIYLYN